MKKFYYLFTVLFLSLLVMSCTQTQNTSKSCDKDPTQEKCVTDKVVIKDTDYKGLTEENAEKLAESQDISFRVVMRDGESLPMTLDYRPGRINAEVNAGIVANYTVEWSEAAVEYDSGSWKTIIADSCTNFSDGCNTCTKEAGSDVAACTRKFCQSYEKPVCLNDAQK